VFPDIKAFGCCHEVFGTQELMMKMLKEFRGIDVQRRDLIRTNIIGINHFTWMDQADYAGMDLIPVFKEFTGQYGEQGFAGPKPEDEDAYFSSGQRVKMDLFKRYGIIAAAGDRHLAEFCPPWYLKDPDTVKEWQFRLTPVSYRKREQARKEMLAKRLVSGEEKKALVPSQEEGVKQMKALLGLGQMVTNINIPNIGQIDGIPRGCVVETNACLSQNSIVPLMAGKLPDEVNSLVLRQVINQETILKAGLNKDKELGFRAFANDALMTLNIHDARLLFDEMLARTKAYLPGWDC
jgi:alpha-galactosidase